MKDKWSNMKILMFSIYIGLFSSSIGIFIVMNEISKGDFFQLFLNHGYGSQFVFLFLGSFACILSHIFLQPSPRKIITSSFWMMIFIYQGSTL